MKSKILEVMEPNLASKSIIYAACFGEMNSEYPSFGTQSQKK